MPSGQADDLWVHYDYGAQDYLKFLCSALEPESSPLAIDLPASATTIVPDKRRMASELVFQVWRQPSFYPCPNLQAILASRASLLDRVGASSCLTVAAAQNFKRPRLLQTALSTTPVLISRFLLRLWSRLYMKVRQDLSGGRWLLFTYNENLVMQLLVKHSMLSIMILCYLYKPFVLIQTLSSLCLTIICI